MDRLSLPTAAWLILGGITLTLGSCAAPETIQEQPRDAGERPSSPPGDRQNVKPLGQSPPVKPVPDAQISPSVRTSITDVQAELGQLYLESIVTAQQVEKLVNGSFTSDFEALELGPLSASKAYQFDLIVTDQKQAIVTATAQQTGLFSYIGAAFSRGTDVPTGICKTNQPSQHPPHPPKLVGTQVVCAPGSSLVSPLTSPQSAD